ncbi:hypothetical protein [Hyphomonas sp.]|nr:hypothetical protein [Hyphomonas sp.]
MFDLRDHVCRATAGGTLLLRLDGTLETAPSLPGAGEGPSQLRTNAPTPPAQFRLLPEQARQLAYSLMESAVAALRAEAATPASGRSRTRPH